MKPTHHVDFLNAISSNREIKNKKATKSKKLQCRVTIGSKIISNDLIKLGCPQSKGEIIRFPTEEQVPKEFIWAFIRGYFDGDGCISFSIRKSKWNGVYPEGSISFESNINFNEGLQKFISNYGIKSGFRIRREGCKSIMLRVGGNLQVKKLGELIYEDLTYPFFKRKYNKFVEFTSLLEIKKDWRVSKKEKNNV